MREGSDFRNQMWATGEASSIWPMRSRRTLASVTSTPHFSQTTPRCFRRLYLPQALVVLDRPEDLGAEQPVALRLEGAVVDGLRLLDLAEGPGPDLLRGGQPDADGVEVLDLGVLLQQIK